MSKIENSMNAIRVGISGSQYRHALQRIYSVEKIAESELSDFGRGVAFGLKFARQVFDDIENFKEVNGLLQEIEFSNTSDL